VLVNFKKVATKIAKKLVKYCQKIGKVALNFKKVDSSNCWYFSWMFVKSILKTEQVQFILPGK
jgi:hypothetical protein